MGHSSATHGARPRRTCSTTTTHTHTHLFVDDVDVAVLQPSVEQPKLTSKLVKSRRRHDRRLTRPPVCMHSSGEVAKQLLKFAVHALQMGEECDPPLPTWCAALAAPASSATAAAAAATAATTQRDQTERKLVPRNPAVY